MCVYIDSLGIHTLSTYTVAFLCCFSPPHCTPLSCMHLSDGYNVAPFNSFHLRASHQTVSGFRLLLLPPGPLFFSLFVRTLCCFFGSVCSSVDPPPFFFRREKNVDFLGSEREVFSLHVMLIGHAELIASSTHQISTTHVAEKTYSCRIFIFSSGAGGELFTNFCFPEISTPFP